MTTGESRATLVRAETTPRESWENGAAPGVSWHTLLSADRTPTSELSVGVCDVQPGGKLSLHRHERAEVYHFLSGAGEVVVEGEITRVRAGDTLFVPGNAWHSIDNNAEETLRLFYCFASDSFADIQYTYGDGSTWQAERVER
jgi:mannose-6-phosphate isomerase-like protein (cupin superfamily)